MACCAQGLEFVWGDGSHKYPDEYPAEDTEIEVQGTFKTYKEKDYTLKAFLDTGNKIKDPYKKRSVFIYFLDFPINDEDIINARKVFTELNDKFKAQIKPEQDEVRELGGLYIIGTERHESRRIDNQLRGRAGRQGDPGVSQFFLSLDDDLMRIFGSDKVKSMVDALGLEEDEPIQAKMLTNAIENAQKNLESRNFDSRKHVLQYDEVMNEQRKIIYAQRQMVLDGEDISDRIRTQEISRKASECSALAPVRAKLVELQKKMGSTKSVIMDGRDIGTVVLKDAELKIYLTASAEERAERRYKELLLKGEDISYEKVLADMQERDYNDMHREITPLRKADDAIELDTTGMSIDEVTEYILRKVK